MYSESDIDNAVARGALTPEAAAGLRAATAADRGAPAPDEESFRLVTGFNDIFVSLAAALLLVAVGWIGAQMGGQVDFRTTSGTFDPQHSLSSMGITAGIMIAAASWLLAEYFTRRRRMALPSILLLLGFAGGLGMATGSLGMALTFVGEQTVTGQLRAVAISAAFAGLITAAATWAHWRRFRVPITIAALTLALVSTIYNLLLAAVPQARSASLLLILLAGLAVFAFAMWWDMSDRERRTRRSDVAFWLHLAAAPMIAHPLFRLMGLLDGEVGVGQALVVLALYVFFALVALAVDRRAILVSSLFYVLYALAALFRTVGAVSLSIALTALVIGSALLVLSAFWQPLRRRVVAALPERWRERLPSVQQPFALSSR